MARKSIDSRMDRIFETLLPVGSMARREYLLPEALKVRLANHRRQSAAIIDRLEKAEPGASFAALCDGTLDTPEMPRALRVALGLVDPPQITADMSISEAARAWQGFVLDDTA